MAWFIAASIAASFAGSNGAAPVCAGGAVRHALKHTRKKKERQNEPVANRREYFIMDPTLEPAPRCRQLHSCAQWPSGCAWPLSRGWGRPPVCRWGYPPDACFLKPPKPEVSQPADRRSAPGVWTFWTSTLERKDFGLVRRRRLRPWRSEERRARQE